VLAAATACGGNSTGPAVLPDDEPPSYVAPPGEGEGEIDASVDANALETLAGTGLCADPACAQINPGIREFAPRASFWDDTATKRRWIYLPPGAKIDTTDMDHWIFPVGTKVWKEFTRDGTRVETRFLMKLLADDNAPDAWFYATYQWNATQDGAKSVVNAVENSNGTQHDIPARNECRACHDGVKPTRLLGFGAIQLDHDAPAGLTDLEDLIAADLLTAAPAGAAPHFPLPGTDVDRAALTYLHANCGHCHNPTSDIHMSATPIDLRLRPSAVDRESVQRTPAYQTTVGQNAWIPFTEHGIQFTKVIVAGDPAHSALIGRMMSTTPSHFMPALAVETVDPAGQAALVAWIRSL